MSQSFRSVRLRPFARRLRHFLGGLPLGLLAPAVLPAGPRGRFGGGAVRELLALLLSKLLTHVLLDGLVGRVVRCDRVQVEAVLRHGERGSVIKGAPGSLF